MKPSAIMMRGQPPLRPTAQLSKSGSRKSRLVGRSRRRSLRLLCAAPGASSVISFAALKRVKEVKGRVRQAGPALVNRAPRGSRPDGFDPRAHCRVARRRHSREGPPPFHSGVAITARRAGALLTGLATALAVGSHRFGVAITAPKAGAILSASASLRRPFPRTRWTDPRLPRYKTYEISIARRITRANADGGCMNCLGRRTNHIRMPDPSSMSRS